jgi:predicted MFS family arabinose efflux permease
MANADVTAGTHAANSPASEFAVSNAYRYYVLGLLLTVGVCSWVDRQILAILLEPIKQEFHFSDTQLGLLGGVAFGLFYATVGLPVAWLADRFNRRNIIAIALGLWSTMTVLCGLAVGFWSLFLARMGVGIGEAGGSPPSQSLISDYFPPEQRGFALGILFMYLPLGFLVGFLLGGWVNEFFGWRVAFVVVGAPGVLLAILLRLTLREPPRGHSEKRTDLGPPPELFATIRYFLSRPALRHLPLAGAIHGIGAWGVALWLPAYFMRVHGMGSGEVGTWLAFIFGIAGATGTFLGGFLADGIVRRTGDHRWYAWFSGLAILITVPFYFLVFLWQTPVPALLFFIFPILIGHVFLGPVTATIQNLGGVRRRAMAAAFYLFLANLISMTCGPLFIGVISDLFQSRYGHESLRYSLLFLVVVTSIWSALHFFLASRTLREDLAAANQ